MQKSSFEREYKKLNPAQKEAVDTIEGPVMVVAGPGTGKTQVLTLRIANILRRTDTEPENILALTFTEAAAASMRRRLSAIIGSPAYGVAVHTFHGFCNEMIKTYPEYFPRIMNATNITEVDQINIIKKFSDFRVKDILKKINDFKKDDISPKKAETTDPKTARVYARYEAELKTHKLYDYNDMILEVLKSLKKNKPLLHTLQEKYHYVLADEHQDTNDAQNKIIEKIMSFHQNPNVFVVGDEKQAIYRFQGASLGNFINFKKKYPGTTMVTLQKNYRSTQTILNAAHGVLPSPAPLVAASESAPKKILCARFTRPEAEAYCIARAIKEKIASGARPHEIALLYRNNKDAFLYSEMLEKMNVPHQIESDTNILGDADIQKIMMILHAIDDPESDQKIISALHVDFLKNEPLAVYTLAARARKNKSSAFETLKTEMPKPYSVFSSWITLSHNANFTDFFQTVLWESGFLAHIMRKKNAPEKINKLNSLFEEIKMLARSRKHFHLSDFTSYLEALEKHGVLVKKSPSLKLKNNVRLMTAHRSKGQEFEYVYIAGAADGHWGGRSTSSRQEGTNDDDERRLFYVALTRAKKEIVISYATENELRREQLKSRFVDEIDRAHIEEHDTQKNEESFEKNKSIVFTPPPSARGSALEKEFVRELFKERGLAVTHLNNYLKCPWEYFYVNLLRIPQAQEKYLIFGNAVHNALEDFLRHRHELAAQKEKKFLMDRFVWHLKKNTLSQNDYEELLQKGEDALPIFYENRKHEWQGLIIPELKIKIAFTPDISLNGKIDKLEFLPDGTVKVTDFKTGRYKTRNEIEGRTKNSQGDIKRQLVFYNLLLNRYKNRKYKMSVAEVDFVQPDNKQRNRREQFVIAPAEIAELEALIRKTAREIRSLSFWNTRCKDNPSTKLGASQCRYCALREMMA